MDRKTTIGLTAAAALIACASAAHATVYTAGSFAFSGTTSATSAVTTTTDFPLVAPPSITPTSGTGSMGSPIVLPATLSLGAGAANFGAGGTSGFNFTNTGLGAFTATSILFLGNTTAGTSATTNYGIEGNFVAGTDFGNSGTSFTADETWSLTQTGGAGNAISVSGTFHSPAVPISTPEPATLAVLGSALAGFAIARRRRHKA